MSLKRGTVYFLKIPQFDKVKVTYVGEVKGERGPMKLFRSRAGGYIISYTPEQWLRCECITLDGIEVEKDIKNGDEMIPITAAAGMSDLCTSKIARACKAGDIEGAIRGADMWLIPLSSARKIRGEQGGARRACAKYAKYDRRGTESLD